MYFKWLKLFSALTGLVWPFDWKLVKQGLPRTRPQRQGQGPSFQGQGLTSLIIISLYAHRLFKIKYQKCKNAKHSSGLSTKKYYHEIKQALNIPNKKKEHLPRCVPVVLSRIIPIWYTGPNSSIIFCNSFSSIVRGIWPTNIFTESGSGIDIMATQRWWYPARNGQKSTINLRTKIGHIYHLVEKKRLNCTCRPTILLSKISDNNNRTIFMQLLLKWDRFLMFLQQQFTQIIYFIYIYL